MRTTRHGTAWPRRIARSVTVATACLVAGVGCQQEIVTPDIITPDNLSGKDALPAIRDAALGDFALAYSGSGADGSGGTEGVILMSGLLSDELINSETFPTRIEVDRRGPILSNNGTATNWFRTQMRARRSAEFAFGRYRALSPDTTAESGFPEMLALDGFIYIFLAENYCNGVPISNANADGTLTFGQPLTGANLLDSAVVRFTQALNAANALNATVSATTKANMINLARVGMGRAMLDQASTLAGFQAAAAAVGAVPTTFVYVVFHSQNTGRQNNGVYVAMAVSKRYAVSDGEGINGLTFRTAFAAGDGRVRVQRTGNGFDGTTPQWNQRRFTDRPNSDPLATGAEARLIEAEAFMNAGDTTSFKATHNALRAAPPSYFNPPDTAIGNQGPLPVITALTTAQLQNLHFKEREFWLWNSGHRLGDLRRLSRTGASTPAGYAGYLRGTETVFPTGNYFKGGLYGPDVNFPVPFDETNNPNFKQCIDRNP